jgi:hypothetical protein
MDMARLKIYSAQAEACGGMVPTPRRGLDQAAHIATPATT